MRNSDNMKSDRPVILYMHAGSGNHGCEAIAATICRMLPGTKEDRFLISYRKGEDDRYSLPQLCTILQERSFDAHKAAHIAYYAYRMLTGDRESFLRYRFREALKIPASIAISIGGDNYCYDSMQSDLILSNRVLNAKGIRTVLLGCSIEPELVRRPDLAEDLGRYRAIAARESITYRALMDAFPGKEDAPQIYLVPDPAFTLETEYRPLPEGFSENHTVGINLSPIAQESEARPGVTMEAYRALIRTILTDTDLQIAFIPHVIWNGNDDRVPCRQLYDHFAKEGYAGRMVMLEDAPASVLKGYIARCRFFIGARTHSTIAAYSSCVPTLVVGYSVKARGIAADLFPGMDQDRLVLQVQKMEPEKIAEAFRWMMENEDLLRTHLEKIMPDYAGKAKETGKILADLLSSGAGQEI